MILIIDNYDSFTYNLFQFFSELSDLPIQVIRNDHLTIDECLNLQPKYVIVSPGPCTPCARSSCQIRSPRQPPWQQ